MSLEMISQESVRRYIVHFKVTAAHRDKRKYAEGKQNYILFALKSLMFRWKEIVFLSTSPIQVEHKFP